ncbi:hypothetical protein CLPUN_32060 [Clostridium puniceum]|uniref:Uncharacterized protein n=1 Tax=Clostridium puniceum TaxID=29367 RepID=A0A1S8TDR5_9CLOT|nr:hypothetical protein [Clostridium puniceum]OOM75535.1 hypothetical protein CLPUN_32060 [Clostridium puniceum]
MGKPSIFSKEYEKKMRKRRRNTIIISLGILVVILGIIIKVIYNPIDYTNIKKNIQAWIDSDTTNVAEKTKAENKEVTNEEKKEPVKEEPAKPVEQSIDVALMSGNIAKAIYTSDINGGKVFKTLESSEKNISFNISPSGKQMLVTDNNALINLYNVEGIAKVLSKDQYISSSGGIFTRADTLKANPKYLWNVNSKFINEEKVIFVTNRPYFGGSNLKQYLWITDIQSGEDKVLWDLAGANIEIAEKEDKGVKINVDGKVYYIDVNGNYIQ